MKNVTYKVFITLMNGLCEGLGDLIDHNSNMSPLSKNMLDKNPVSYWLKSSFTWAATEPGYDAIQDIYSVIRDMETGAGVSYRDDVSCASAAMVVYFKQDLKGELFECVKRSAAECGLDVVCTLGNTMVVSPGPARSVQFGGIASFKRKLGIDA